MSTPLDLAGRAWRCFRADVREEDAAAHFQALYGRPPEFILEDHGVLFVGPIPAELTPAQQERAHGALAS